MNFWQVRECSNTVHWTVLLHYEMQVKVLKGFTTWPGSTQYHTDSQCPIWFVNCFWHLNVGNRSIVLNFYLQRPVFALKIHPRPQRPKRPMKAKKGHQRPDLQKSLISSIFHVKSCIYGNVILWKSCFSKSGNFHFHNIKLLKLHFVKNIKIAGFCW